MSDAKNDLEVDHARKSSVSRGFSSVLSKKHIAALLFVFIYAYPALNAFLPTKGVLGLYIDIVSFCVIPAAGLYTLYRVDLVFRLVLIDGLKQCSWKNSAALLLCGILFAYVDMYAQKYFNGNVAANDVVTYALQTGGLLGVFYLALSAGVFEELLYKALLNYAVPGRIGNASFAILSGVIFGAAHIEQGISMTLLTILCFGIPTAYYYRVSNNLLGLMIMHFVVDFLLFGRIWAWLYL